MSSLAVEKSASTYEPGFIGRGVTIAWVAAFFSHVPIYITLFVAPIVRPLHWMYVFGALFLVWWFRPSFWRHKFSAGLPAWIFAYSALTLIWFSSFGGGEPEALRQRIVAMMFLLVTFAAISVSARVIESVRYAILAIVLISVAVNAYDISHPFVLIPADSEFAILGRAAGLYVNPNQAGAALVLGLILTLGVIPVRWRSAYLAYVGAGVVLTLSRSAMLGLSISVAGLWICNVLRARQIFGAVLLASLAGLLAATYLLPMLSENFGLDPALVYDRLLWIMDPEARADFSQAERVSLAQMGWQQFLNSPLVGNGLGSTELWEARTSTHNVYLMLLSDFGLIGALIVPALLFAVMRGPGAALVPERLAFALFVLVIGALSHSVLTEYYFLVSFAMMAALCGKSKVAGSGLQTDITGRVDGK